MMSDHPPELSLSETLRNTCFLYFLGKEKIQCYKDNFWHLKTQTAKIMSLYLKGWNVSRNLYKALNKNKLE